MFSMVGRLKGVTMTSGYTFVPPLIWAAQSCLWLAVLAKAWFHMYSFVHWFGFNVSYTFKKRIGRKQTAGDSGYGVWRLRFGMFETDSWWRTPCWVSHLTAEKKKRGRFIYIMYLHLNAFDLFGTIVPQTQCPISLLQSFAPFDFFFEWFVHPISGVCYMSFLVGFEHHL